MLGSHPFARTGQVCPPHRDPGCNTCHHNSTDARLPQGLYNWGCLWLQQVPHDQQPQEAQLLLHSVPRRLTSPGKRSDRHQCHFQCPRRGNCLGLAPPSRYPGTGFTLSAAERPQGWAQWAVACQPGPQLGSQQLCSSAVPEESLWALWGESVSSGLVGRGVCVTDRNPPRLYARTH